MLQKYLKTTPNLIPQKKKTTPNLNRLHILRYSIRRKTQSELVIGCVGKKIRK